ncbi:MAG: energy transducer TonB [Acidobacteriota bacterium]|nr:energy transducer TonB [Acidobacteriota bacterium]
MKKNLLAILSVMFASLLFVFAAYAQTRSNSNKNEKKTEKQEKDQPLKIKRKPVAEIGNCEQSSGRIALRVTFDKSAKVTNVEIVKQSGCASFDSNAIRAARGIKFNPVIKNGEPVTVKKLVEYNFTKY